MTEENSFGKKLRELRVTKHWTQKGTAEGLGVSLHTYSNWETGKHIPSPYHRTQIAKLFRLKQEEADALYRAAGQVPPETNNLPVQNPFFTGREAQLKHLKQLLEENKSVAISQPISISGLGGIGKTQMALEYAHCWYPKVYRAVFWVDAAGGTMLQRSYEHIAHTLELPERSEHDLERLVQAVKRWLETHRDWLLILDNADDLYLARTFLPAKPLGHIVVTTRSQAVSALGTQSMHIGIEAMEPEEGLLFLLKRAGMAQQEADIATLAAHVRDAAVELVTLLGGLPLALDQAGAYIEEAGISVAVYLQRYQEARRSLLQKRGSAGESDYGDHPKSVAATVELSIEDACKQHPMAADILNFCSFLQPDTIPEEVLLQEDGLTLDWGSFDEAIKALQRYSLIKRNAEEKTLSMHRLVQAVTIDTISPEIRTRWRGRVAGALNAIFAKVEFKERKRFACLMTHALVCATWTEDELTPTLDISELLQKVSDYLLQRGQFTEAEPLLVRAVSMREQHLGAKSLSTAFSLNSLAWLYGHQNKYEQAVTLSQRALTIQEQQLGTKHPKIATSLNNLAAYYQGQGEYEQAEVLHQRALSIKEQCQGDEHPEVAISLDKLAMFYMQQGKYEQAEALYRRALTIREQYLGTEHGNTIVNLYNLEAVYQRQEKYEQAELMYQHALMIREHSLGSKHYVIAPIMHRLAVLYSIQCKYEQAELMFQRKIAIIERNLGTEHPETAYPIQGLAELYQQQGKNEQAEALYRRALTISEQLQRPGHPGTRMIRDAFVKFLRILGRDPEAAAIESSPS